MRLKMRPHNAEVLKGPNDLDIYYTGPGLTKDPLPALFYFALSGEESLTLDPFNQPAAFLSDQPIHIFSFTLPGHGPGFINTKAMALWAHEISIGNDIVEEFIEKAVANIDFLAREGYIDSRHMAAAGLSRGSLIASHLAARDERIGNVLGFAPLIKFDVLEEFQELLHHPLVKKWDLFQSIDVLADRRLRFYIGNRDTRVSTRYCFDFIEALANKSYEKGFRSPEIELIISPSIGHKGHGTPPHVFKNGIEWLKQKLGRKDASQTDEHV